MSSQHELATLFVDAWASFATSFPTGRVERRDGVVATLAQIELAFLNACFHEGPLADEAVLRTSLRTAVDVASSCPHPWFHVLCEDHAHHAPRLGRRPTAVRGDGLFRNVTVPHDRASARRDVSARRDDSRSHAGRALPDVRGFGLEVADRLRSAELQGRQTSLKVTGSAAVGHVGKSTLEQSMKPGAKRGGIGLTFALTLSACYLGAP